MCNGSVGAEGRPHVVDRRGKGIVAIGIESFADVVARHVYVDKTMVIADLLDRGGVTLFCRPRRFGKSLMLRTLQCYFEAPVEGFVDDKGPLFDGLAVMDAGDYYTADRGVHPVIYLGLNACGGDTWQAMRASVAQLISAEYSRHRYLLDSPALPRFQREKFERIWAATAPVEELEQSLTYLVSLLRDYHRQQVVILIDEYDKIVTEGHLHGYRDEATGFLKRWLTGALKGTVDLRLAALTGVQRVSKESIFSDLNNFTVDTALNHEYSEAFGFTQPSTRPWPVRASDADNPPICSHRARFVPAFWRARHGLRVVRAFSGITPARAPQNAHTGPDSCRAGRNRGTNRGACEEIGGSGRRVLPNSCQPRIASGPNCPVNKIIWAPRNMRRPCRTRKKPPHTRQVCGGFLSKKTPGQVPSQKPWSRIVELALPLGGPKTADGNYSTVHREGKDVFSGTENAL